MFNPYNPYNSYNNPYLNSNPYSHYSYMNNQPNPQQMQAQNNALQQQEALVMLFNQFVQSSKGKEAVELLASEFNEYCNALKTPIK